jgi:uncharacterized protein YbdZ (MbtH family)
MKYNITFLVAVLLMLSGRLSADNITVDNIRMSPGETKKVGIVLKNPNYQYVAFQFDIVVPEGISVVNNDKGKPDITLNEERSDDHTLIVQSNNSGVYQLISYSMPIAAYSGTDGALVFVTLKVADNCPEGNKSVIIKSQRFTDSNNDEKRWDDMSFIVEVKKEDSGGQGDEPVAEGDHLKVDDVFIRPGGTRQIAIQLINKQRQYVGFQFELALPAGVSIVSKNDKFEACINSSRSEDHTFSVQSVGNNTYRFLAYSMPIMDFSGSEGPLVYVTLQADNTVNEMIGTVKSQRFTTPDEENEGIYKEVKWDDVSFKVCVGTIPGDANGDGDVTYSDVVAVLKYIMENESEGFDRDAADVNNDGKITVADMVGILDIILRK